MLNFIVDICTELVWSGVIFWIFIGILLYLS